MPGAEPMGDAIIGQGINSIEGKAFEVPTHTAINRRDRKSIDATYIAQNAPAEEISNIRRLSVDESSQDEKDDNSEDKIIITGADAAEHLLPMRDDHDSSLTFRGLFLATGLSAFQAVMYQIYMVSSQFCASLPCIRLMCHAVQTNARHHPGHFHCPHRVLPRQRLG